MTINRPALANAFDLAFCDGGIDDFELLSDRALREISDNDDLRDEGVTADDLYAELVILRNRANDRRFGHI